MLLEAEIQPVKLSAIQLCYVIRSEASDMANTCAHLLLRCISIAKNCSSIS